MFPVLGTQGGLDKLSVDGAKEGGQLSRRVPPFMLPPWTGQPGNPGLPECPEGPENLSTSI